MKNLTSMQRAARMIEDFARFRKNYEQQDFKPVESFQFSIDAMECYLKYVKCLSSLKGVKVTGIRVVNAVYPSDHEDSEKRNQQTVLFIPTYNNDKDEDEAFDPLYVRDGNPLKLNELLKKAEGRQNLQNQDDMKSKSMALSSIEEEEDESSFMNFGNLGRPPIKD